MFEGLLTSLIHTTNFMGLFLPFHWTGLKHMHQKIRVTTVIGNISSNKRMISTHPLKGVSSAANTATANKTTNCMANMFSYATFPLLMNIYHILVNVLESSNVH